MKRQYYLCVMWLIIFCLGLNGCVTISENIKEIAGLSIKPQEEARRDAAVKVFNLVYSTCYAKSLDILKSLGTYIYAQGIDKHLIAFYLREDDTTAVAIFFKAIDNNKTQIEVSSPSAYVKNLIARKLFLPLEKLANIDTDLTRVINETQKVTPPSSVK